GPVDQRRWARRATAAGDQHPGHRGVGRRPFPAPLTSQPLDAGNTLASPSRGASGFEPGDASAGSAHDPDGRCGCSVETPRSLRHNANHYGTVAPAIHGATVLALELSV